VGTFLDHIVDWDTRDVQQQKYMAKKKLWLVSFLCPASRMVASIPIHASGYYQTIWKRIKSLGIIMQTIILSSLFLERRQIGQVLRASFTLFILGKWMGLSYLFRSGILVRYFHHRKRRTLHRSRSAEITGTHHNCSRLFYITLCPVFLWHVRGRSGRFSSG
jgi:hypothetical protein